MLKANKYQESMPDPFDFDVTYVLGRSRSGGKRESGDSPRGCRSGDDGGESQASGGRVFRKKENATRGVEGTQERRPVENRVGGGTAETDDDVDGVDHQRDKRWSAQ